MLSSASTPNSRPITPNTRPAVQQKPVQSQSSIGGDAFSSLLGGTLGSNGNGTANMTIAERAKRAEAERLRQASMPKPVAPTILAAGPSTSSSASKISPGLLDDDDWGFGAAPVKAAPAQKAQPAPTQALWDHLDDFASAKPSSPAPASPARYASPTADFDFGDREDNTGGDDFDLLGDLGKPPTPQQPARETPSPAEPPARRKPQQRSASPPPHILGQLIEMGFSVPQARTALAGVYSDGTWDVQAAIDSLLAATGGAEGSSRPSTPASSNAAPPAPRRRPTAEREGRRGSPQQPPPQERTATPTGQTDLLARTSELGFSLFKNAERAWQQGKERVQKVYEEHIVGEETAKTERPNARSGGPAARARPKWMQDHNEPEEPGPSGGRRRDDAEQLWEDSARGKDDGWGESAAGGWKDDDDNEPPQPKAPAPKKAAAPVSQPKVDLFSDAAPAKPYVSPFRHGRPKPPTAVSAPAPVTARPVPPQAAHPPRPQIPLPPGALRTSRSHAATAQEKVALGQYGAALSAYTLAVDALPTGHVLLVPLLNMRAVARLKEGDFRGVEADAATVEGIATVGGRSFGAERVVVEGTPVEMGEAVVEAGGKKWDEAGRDWERVAGAAWAKQGDRDEGVRGAGRCRKIVAPAEAPAAPKPKPKPKAPPVRAGSFPPSEAVTKFRQEVKAQEEEDLAKHQLKDTVDGKLIAWKGGKETNIRGLGLQPAGMKDLVTPGQVKIRYVKAIAKLHPDKRMVANGVFGR
ncbi:hypothetical protein B0H14DRAFT_3103735 [Mycena olivaceomarginata]|nr:hypothetical protein B0H14DRAFT_3103735 [Mycena olivaceomarginata]